MIIHYKLKRQYDGVGMAKMIEHLRQVLGIRFSISLVAKPEWTLKIERE